MKQDKLRLNDYPFTIRPLSTEDGGGYSIEFPDVPGCLSDGETPEEAIENGCDALKSALLTLREFGDPIPKPSSLRASMEAASTEVTPLSPRRPSAARGSQPEYVGNSDDCRRPRQTEGQLIRLVRTPRRSQNCTILVHGEETDPCSFLPRIDVSFICRGTSPSCREERHVRRDSFRKEGHDGLRASRPKRYRSCRSRYSSDGHGN